jgi:hypothetical protein
MRRASLTSLAPTHPFLSIHHRPAASKAGEDAPTKRPKRNEDLIKVRERERREKERARKTSPGAARPALKPSQKHKKHKTQQAITAKWERLRRSDTPADERAALAADVLDAAKGAVARLAMSHTASRVLQAAAKHAPPGARAAAVAEVRADAIPLAKSSYGHFLVVKLIAGAPKDEVAGEREGGFFGLVFFNRGR